MQKSTRSKPTKQPKPQYKKSPHPKKAKLLQKKQFSTNRGDVLHNIAPRPQLQGDESYHQQEWGRYGKIARMTPIPPSSSSSRSPHLKQPLSSSTTTTNSTHFEQFFKNEHDHNNENDQNENDNNNKPIISNRINNKQRVFRFPNTPTQSSTSASPVSYHMFTPSSNPLSSLSTTSSSKRFYAINAMDSVTHSMLSSKNTTPSQQSQRNNQTILNRLLENDDNHQINSPLSTNNRVYTVNKGHEQSLSPTSMRSARPVLSTRRRKRVEVEDGDQLNDPTNYTKYIDMFEPQTTSIYRRKGMNEDDDEYIDTYRSKERRWDELGKHRQDVTNNRNHINMITHDDHHYHHHHHHPPHGSSFQPHNNHPVLVTPSPSVQSISETAPIMTTTKTTTIQFIASPSFDHNAYINPTSPHSHSNHNYGKSRHNYHTMTPTALAHFAESNVGLLTRSFRSLSTNGRNPEPELASAESMNAPLDQETKRLFNKHRIVTENVIPHTTGEYIVDLPQPKTTTPEPKANTTPSSAGHRGPYKSTLSKGDVEFLESSPVCLDGVCLEPNLKNKTVD